MTPISRIFASIVMALSLHAQAIAAGQDIVDESGKMFMEETTPTPPAASQKKLIPIDLSRVGVPVDERGRIVPIIDKSAPDGVRRNFSNLETYTEPAWNFLPAPVYNGYGQPYNFYPNVPPYGFGTPFGFGRPFGMPYGYGYPYGYGSPYGFPYGNPYYNNGIGFNIGRMRVNLGSPGMLGFGGYGGYGFGNPYGFAGFGNPYGFGGFGTPLGFGSPYGFNNGYGVGNSLGFGNPFGGFGNSFGFGGINLNPITNPTPTGQIYYNSPYGYPAAGGLFGPPAFPIATSPLFGSSLFTPQQTGLGLSIFTPPKVEWQSTNTYTPLLAPTLDTTDK